MATMLPGQTWDMLQMLGVIVAFSLCVMIMGVLLYRRLKKQVGQSSRDGAFSLLELRRMHRRGQLTDDEFERAKAVVIARGLAQWQREKPADSVADMGTSDKAAADTSDNGDRAK